MLLKSDTNAKTTSGLHEINYDSSLTHMSMSDELYSLNKEQCEHVCESNHVKMGKAYEMMLTKITLKDLRLCSEINKKRITMDMK